MADSQPNSLVREETAAEVISRKRKPEEVDATRLKKKKDGGTAQALNDQAATAADDSEAASIIEIRERRELRKEQRQTLEDLRNSWVSMKGLDVAALQAERKRHNELFHKVRHAREFKLDAEILSARASNIHELVSAAQETHRFDPVELVCKLKDKVVSITTMGKGGEKEKKTSFDWFRFGREACVAFKCVPPNVTFLVGPLSSQAPGKKPRRTYTRGSNKDEPQQPLVEQVLVASTTKEENDTPTVDAAALVKVIKKELRKQCTLAPHGEIDMIPFLVNPLSFTQTVENFLNFSHLVKKGEAGVRRASDGMIYCTTSSITKKNPKDGSPKEETTDSYKYYPARQIVMPLSVKDWQSLVEAYSLTKGGLPDRGYHSKERSLDNSMGDVSLDDPKAADGNDQE